MYLNLVHPTGQNLDHFYACSILTGSVHKALCLGRDLSWASGGPGHGRGGQLTRRGSMACAPGAGRRRAPARTQAGSLCWGRREPRLTHLQGRRCPRDAQSDEGPGRGRPGQARPAGVQLGATAELKRTWPGRLVCQSPGLAIGAGGFADIGGGREPGGGCLTQEETQGGFGRAVVGVEGQTACPGKGGGDREACRVTLRLRLRGLGET